MSRAQITAGFWRQRLDVNSGKAIFHQWQQLEASGCIQNFRLAAGEAQGLREGWFFADSDAYKWLEAAARIQAEAKDSRLEALIDELVGLLGRAQDEDGYLFTYNQFHFPGTRWVNLLIEHELYCHGHLIEAGVSHYECTGRSDLLDIARRAADRVVEDFRGKGTEFTPGHEEIEIALLRLHEVVYDDMKYLQLARQFIEQRGRSLGFEFAISLLRQNRDVERREKIVRARRAEYLRTHPAFKPYELPPGNVARRPRTSSLRWISSVMSGQYFQQHAAVRRQTVPVGHAVRFGYLATAAARLCHLTGDATLLEPLEQAWERMVTRRMYVTGGLGSLPSLEGFGNDYELDPEYAYAETCAALASMFWSWEMAQLTGRPRYSDLFEWQLYNASGVGMGSDGTTYLYNNPLACRGGVTRKPWYAVPCCPSNLSRTWADLARYIYSRLPPGLKIHQYINSDFLGQNYTLHMRTGLPWEGWVSILVEPVVPAQFTLSLRLPSWSPAPRVEVNGENVDLAGISPDYDLTVAAQGYDPRWARQLSVKRTWKSGDEIHMDLGTPLILRTASSSVRGHAGRLAVTRGPLVYCLESIDNPGVDIFNARLDPASLHDRFDQDLLGGIVKLEGRSQDGQPLTLIPYYLWANRGESQVNVWINRS